MDREDMFTYPASMDILNDSLMSWASILEPKTRAQAFDTASMPFIYPYMALMPDAHLGIGATVGSVIPTEGAIIPAAVGVDIGCGMQAVQTYFTKTSIDQIVSSGRPLSELHSAISSAVPLSPGNGNGNLTHSARTRIAELEALPGIKQADAVSPNWRSQLGSLGGGNHFIEVSLDEDDAVWLFLHSGSRGVGNRLASTHIKAARAECEQIGGIKLPNKDLSYLTEGTASFDAYLEALLWAQHFALLNRDEMMDRVKDCFASYMGSATTHVRQKVSCHHNYTVRERLAGRDVWLSRKGAIDASFDVMGLIPGSMGDLSYVVRGLGNEQALYSAPHGAGRNHSRSAAKALFSREDLDKRMKGVAWGESDSFLDEHPSAYKPIDVVMKDASELVDVVHELRQIVNVKGH